MHQPYVLFAGDFVGKPDETRVVGMGHRRKASAELVVVVAAQRVFGEQVDVVGDDHKVADFEFFVHAARGIADEKYLYAEGLENAHGEGNGLHIVTFVVVEAALHCDNALFAESSEYEIAFVALDC